MNLIKQRAVIRSNDMIFNGIFSMWIENHAIAKLARPGQFLAVYCNDRSRLLPRPISICEIDEIQSAVRIVYRVAGKGTDEFSSMTAGQQIEIMGPLGNGYNLQKEGKAVLFGGGIGIPPMLELAKQLTCEKTIVLGFRDKSFLKEEFRPYGTVIVASEDGSCGMKGNVIDAAEENAVIGDMIYACGPMPMLRGVKKFSETKGIPAQISLEERMACGVGACLGCVCRSVHKDEHLNVNKKRICKEGPVFLAEEVEI